MTENQKKRIEHLLRFKKVALALLLVDFLLTSHFLLGIYLSDRLHLLRFMYIGYIGLGAGLTAIALGLTGYLLLVGRYKKPRKVKTCWCQHVRLIGPFSAPQGDYYFMDTAETSKIIEDPKTAAEQIAAMEKALPKINEAGLHKIFVENSKKEEFQKSLSATTLLSPLHMGGDLAGRMMQDVNRDVKIAQKQAEAEDNGSAEHQEQELYFDPPPAYPDESMV